VNAGTQEALEVPDIGEADALVAEPVLDAQEEEVASDFAQEMLQIQNEVTAVDDSFMTARSRGSEIEIEVNDTIEIVNDVVNDSVIDLTSDNNDGNNSPIRLGNDWTNSPSILARLPPPPRRVDTPPPWTPRRAPAQPPVMVDLTNSPNISLNSPLPDLNNTASPGAVTLQCPVCLDSIKSIKRKGSSMMSTMCGHIFCSKCLPASIRTSGRCPTCRGRIGHQDYHKIFI